MDANGLESSSSEDDNEDDTGIVREGIQGYTKHKDYVIAWGSPICDKSRWATVARKFIHFCQSNGLVCVWTCVGEEFERVLSEPDLNWSSLSCIRQVCCALNRCIAVELFLLGHCRLIHCQPHAF